MKFYGNNVVEDESDVSYASDNTKEIDFDFDSDELVDNLDELELSDEDLNAYQEEPNLMNENDIADGGFTSISLKERTAVSVFPNFFTEEISNLITDQTNVYGKGKKRSNNQKKTNNWKNVSKKDIESFLGLIILMGRVPVPNFDTKMFAYLHRHRSPLFHTRTKIFSVCIISGFFSFEWYTIHPFAHLFSRRNQGHDF